MNEKIYQIALSLVPKVGAVTAKHLIRTFGSAELVFKTSKANLAKIHGIGPTLIENLKDPNCLSRAVQSYESMQINGVHMLDFQSEKYPTRLKQVHDAPAFLFYKGPIDFQADRVIAIIGTRKPSKRALQITYDLIEGLKAYQPIIISGLAFGVDAFAHQSALQLDLPTWGVMAHGHHMVYPAAHRKLTSQILHQDGALLSEYAFFTRPEKEFFPMRNRIVAGLCKALVVVETPKRGGSMITAQLANTYHKDVFAVPGRWQDTQSKGCNHLIKSHQAALIESADDIAYVLGWEQASKVNGLQQELFSKLSEEEKIIVDLLRAQDILSYEQLLYRIPNSKAIISQQLLNLEFMGLIRSLPGSRYILK